MKVSMKGGTYHNIKSHKKPELYPLSETEPTNLLRVSSAPKQCRKEQNDMRRLDVKSPITKELQEITVPI